MADELDLDVEPKSDGKKKKLIIIIGVVLLVVIATGAALYFTGVIGGNKHEADESADKGEAARELPAKALYIKLSPEFTVNFENPTVANYLQMDIQVMSREQDVLTAIETHMPVIRNNIILLLSSQKYEEISTPAGKEKLRAEVLKTIQDVMQAEIGKPGVEAVYFTSFIMQ